MRGTLPRGGLVAGDEGIIPAYAGNTSSRICDVRAEQGSSPRMRGTLGFARFHAFDAGIIPAYAGNTYSTVNVHVAEWDHPRVCGEHLTPDEAHRVGEGSSPRMRGTPIILPLTVSIHGIIPAYAGNTSAYVWCKSETRDHPRVCGEHCGVEHSPRPVWGSSPRMRGTRPPRPSVPRPSGIIPAYAGNTNDGQHARFDVRDHPRVCGEHALFLFPKGDSTGSSPRMRGTPRVFHADQVVAGIIPAYAGNTWRLG